MTRFNLVHLPFIVMLGGAFVPVNADVIFTDGTFNLADYTVTTYTAGGGTATPTQCSSCGNPGTALQIVMTSPGPSLITADTGYANNTFSYNPSVQGAITSISASVDKDLTLIASAYPATLGDTFRPMIEQGGVLYVDETGIVGTGLVETSSTSSDTTGYETLSQTGLVAADFVEFDFTTGTYGTTNPNFDGGAMSFGLAQLTTASGSTVTITADYDNLNLDLVTAVPEPSPVILLLTTLLAVAFVARKRIAQGL